MFKLLLQFTFLIICFPKLNKVRIDSYWNYVIPLIFLFIIIAASAWLTYLFESRLAAQIQQALNYLVDRAIRRVPIWMYRLCILFLILGFIYILNGAIRYLSNNLYLVIVKNGINTLAKWVGTFVGIFSTIIQLYIINIPDLRIGILVRNVDGNEKLIRDSYIGNDIKANTPLKIIATNKGRAKATYRLWGICAQNETLDLCNKELKSQLVQPKIYYKKKSNECSINEKGELLGENESSNVYYLKFKKIPKENFQIVFLEYPNKLVFLPVYVKKEKLNYDFLKSKLFWIPIIMLVILIVTGKTLEKKVKSKGLEPEERIITINKQRYNLLKEENYTRNSLYSVANTNLKLKKLDFYRKKHDINCLLIVTNATEENVYLKKCQVVTKNKRRYPAEIESRYQEKTKNLHSIE